MLKKIIAIDEDGKREISIAEAMEIVDQGILEKAFLEKSKKHIPCLDAYTSIKFIWER